MAQNLVNLDKLPAGVEVLISAYCRQMITWHGENLKAIMVYGSAVNAEDFVPEKSNINLLIILERMDLSDLKRCAKLVARGQRKKKIIPLFLTMLHIQTSSDVFPIEFLEMKENHILLFGEEVFKEVEISPQNIRLECEKGLKGKLIRLRQGYLEVGTKPKSLELLMVDSFTSFVPIFRNMLRLKQKELPAKKQQVVAGVCEVFGVDEEPFLKILEAKLRKRRLTKTEIEAVFENYIEQVRRLSVAVDQLKVGVNSTGEGEA